MVRRPQWPLELEQVETGSWKPEQVEAGSLELELELELELGLTSEGLSG